ncbi:MAG: FKBP-type peptidyl-prolyl cis-trans isomerase [Gammaproteobacteria bacterium]
MQITIGSRVTMHFSLSLADGMPVESSYGDEPVTFVVGDGTLDNGLELALIGLRPDDKQALTLMPGQAFGQRHSAAVRWIPRTRFPQDMRPEPGQIIGFTDENGEELPGAVLEVAAEQVKVDFNHPLAGREIIFDVHILAVENPMEQEG